MDETVAHVRARGTGATVRTPRGRVAGRALGLALAAFLLAGALVSGAVRAEGASSPAAGTDAVVIDAAAALKLLDRVTADPWQADRALVLPQADAPSGTSTQAPLFRVTVEGSGATHTAVVFPSQAPQGEATALGSSASALSAGGTICRIHRATTDGSADAMAVALKAGGAPLLDRPKPHAAVTERLEIRGRAAGTWFAEAEFPVKLLANDGHELAATSAVAEGNWMTEDYVPFRAELRLQGPPPDRAMLVLERANPSGLARNAGFLLVRVGCG